MLLNIPQCKEYCPQQILWPQISLVPRLLRNPGLVRTEGVTAETVETKKRQYIKSRPGRTPEFTDIKGNSEVSSWVKGQAMGRWARIGTEAG